MPSMRGDMTAQNCTGTPQGDSLPSLPSFTPFFFFLLFFHLLTFPSFLSSSAFFCVSDEELFSGSIYFPPLRIMQITSLKENRKHRQTKRKTFPLPHISIMNTVLGLPLYLSGAVWQSACKAPLQSGASWLSHILVMWPWPSYFTSTSLSFTTVK